MTRARAVPLLLFVWMLLLPCSPAEAAPHVYVALAPERAIAALDLSPEPSRDLRRLKTRYGERMIEITYKAAVEGRPTKSMPTWGDALGRGAIQEIVAFLESVQN
jgi:hypothetical protein